MRRREFITLLGGAAATWPLAARAQQHAMPVIGLLGSSSADEFIQVIAALRAGLNELGFIEGQNVAVEYRWAHGNYDLLPALAAELVNRQVAVIVTTGAEPSALVAKAATTKIPIVFVIDGDPVSIGLVESLNRPGGNVTGMSLIASALEAKRLELLRELVPKNTLIAVLVNPDYPDTDFQVGGLEAAASDSGQKIYVLNARNEGDLDTAFTTMFNSEPAHSSSLPTRYSIGCIIKSSRWRHVIELPAIYELREFVAAGGVISYGASIAGAYRGPVSIPARF